MTGKMKAKKNSKSAYILKIMSIYCLLYTSDAADEL